MDKYFNLSRQETEEMKQALREYLREEQAIELGNLGAELMLRFLCEQIGPVFYNLGVRDAGNYLSDRILDLSEIEIPTPSRR